MPVYFDSRTSHLCFKVAEFSHAMADATSEESSRKHYCIVGIVFCAFAVEAMLNHYGDILVRDWKNTERKLGGKRERHKTVFDKANMPGFLGTSVYQKIKECFLLRDNLAHGRSYDKIKDVEIDQPGEKGSVWQVLSAGSSLEAEATFDRLDCYIRVANEIQAQIESNGVYPSWSSKSGQNFCEWPLSLQGARLWPSK